MEKAQDDVQILLGSVVDGGFNAALKSNVADPKKSAEGQGKNDNIKRRKAKTNCEKKFQKRTPSE
jgi:hypothetical protein